MQELLKQPDSQKKNEAIREWLVKCAENEYTRWEGLYELSPQSDFMYYYDEKTGNLTQGNYLTMEQRKRLFEVLMATKTAGYNDIGLVDLCISINDEKLLSFLKAKMKAFDKESFWFAEFYMQKIVTLTKSTELGLLMKEFEEILYQNDEKSLKRQKELLKLFIEKMENTTIDNKASASSN